MLTEEDKAEISTIVAKSLADDFDRRRMARLNSDAKTESNKESRLYLITLLHHQIGFPDQRGRTILNQSFYARMTMDKDNPHFFGGRVEVLAYGDGEVLEVPHKVILTGSGVASFCEVSDDYLERLAKNARGATA